MPVKKIKTLQALKKNLKKTLPQKISEVIQSYEDFSEQPAPVDAKGFSAHHTACKSAVIHAETLLKLARWTEDELLPAEDNSAELTSMQQLLAEAQAEDLPEDEE